MKKIRKNLTLSVLICLCMALNIMPVSAADNTPDVWNGTTDTSWYNDGFSEFHLETAEEVAGLAKLVNEGNTFSQKTIYLEKDIDLNNIQWISIADGYQKSFAGVFDGQQHYVSNLKNIQNSYKSTGFFGCVNSAIIKNLGIIGANISSTYFGSDIGILADYAINSKILNCFTTGKLTVGQNGYFKIGGIIGVAETGTQIIGSYSSVTLTTQTIGGADAIGGIVGAWRTASSTPPADF